jgi:alpha-tubulin suppressor-like RCC1 family protein
MNMRASKYLGTSRIIFAVSIVIVLGAIPLLLPIFPAAAAPESPNLWAWGANYSEQLGSGTSNSNIPVQISGLDEVVSIAAGNTHILALKSDGTVWAWGTNYSGELGDGTNINSNIPVQVSGLTDVVAIAASGD